MNWLQHLRHEWSKNDGKPREEWAPGCDLKEGVMIWLLVGLTVAQVGIVAWWMVKG